MMLVCYVVYLLFCIVWLFAYLLFGLITCVNGLFVILALLCVVLLIMFLILILIR